MSDVSLKQGGAPPAERIYTALLYLYPTNFRRAYADELTMLFVDMHRAAAAQGARASVKLWLTLLLDLTSSVVKERTRVMLNSKLATGISVALCVPILFMLFTATFNYEPPFVQQLDSVLFNPDGYTPTVLGRIVMLGLLLSAPAAFVINLLSMLKKANGEQAAPFVPTRSHAAFGLTTLATVLTIFSQPVLHELNVFMKPLGSAAIIGQGMCLLALLLAPVAFLLNRLPRATKSGTEVSLIFQPTSINLIIGAATLLMIIMLVSAFALETASCQFIGPNCD